MFNQYQGPTTFTWTPTNPFAWSPPRQSPADPTSFAQPQVGVDRWLEEMQYLGYTPRQIFNFLMNPATQQIDYTAANLFRNNPQYFDIVGEIHRRLNVNPMFGITERQFLNFWPRDQWDTGDPRIAAQAEADRQAAEADRQAAAAAAAAAQAEAERQAAAAPFRMRDPGGGVNAYEDNTPPPEPDPDPDPDPAPPKISRMMVNPPAGDTFPCKAWTNRHLVLGPCTTKNQYLRGSQKFHPNSMGNAKCQKYSNHVQQSWTKNCEQQGAFGNAVARAARMNDPPSGGGGRKKYRSKKKTMGKRGGGRNRTKRRSKRRVL